MAADHLEFPKNKFINDFQEVVEEFEELPLRLHFQNILKVLQEKTMSPSTPIVLKNPLYQVRFALEDCVMFAEKERERKAQNKKSHYNVHHVRKLWFLCKIGKKLVRIEAKLRETGDNAAVESSPLGLNLITVSERLSSYEPIFRPTIYGFDDQLQKIENLLLKTPDANSINTVGIVGMGGVGKTALANEIFWRVKSQFDLKLWIHLSQKLNPEDVDSRIEIVRKILKHFKETTNHASLDNLLRALYDNLRDKRYLIVLDNVWHESNWYANLNSLLQMDDASNSSNLSHGLPKGSRGAIIVTSRLKKVAHGMVGEHNLVQLHPTLDEESCWSIFMDSVRRKSDMLSYENIGAMKRMKEEIVDNCGGLPLATMTLAEFISIQMAKRKYWPAPDVRKLIYLGLHVYDVEDLEKAIEKLRRLPGVFHIKIEERPLAIYPTYISYMMQHRLQPNSPGYHRPSQKFTSNGRGFQAQQQRDSSSSTSQCRPPPPGERRMTPAERDKYREQQCQYCGMMGHIAKICWWVPKKPIQQDEIPQALAALTLDNTIIDTEWTTDTGASNHMTGSSGLPFWFEFVTVRPPRSVNFSPLIEARL
ncbi:hypothetical protein F0562_006926 [Nyssa sinensis]|uniref:NB-ARC domain-containing protein n=1 Tax=Nyssa sinensis TaxID=561372 RepID=A0A5J5A443_9ASTE|nr:hypothetical protein F0562_006926 [Nyssa sinensis]